jgi:hypothetical protein
LAACRQPSFYFRKIPHYATWRQIEAPRKFATAFHVVDRRIGKRDQLMQFGSADGALEGKRARNDKLVAFFVLVHAARRFGRRAANIDVVELIGILVIHLLLSPGAMLDELAFGIGHVEQW